MGQSTAIYAKPNSGKTLLTIYLLIESIEGGNVNGEDVFYINADDDYKGLVTKVKLGEKTGFHMLAPSFNGFESNELLNYLSAMISSGTASGKVMILDTLKKFTDIMDKKVASRFGRIVREFEANGGTVIMLAHTNKNRDNDGKVVFSGTSDIVDDVDCAYTLDVVEDNEGVRSVVFENIKSRGDVAKTVGYTYSTKGNQAYEDLLNTVCEADQDYAEKARTQKLIADKLEANEDAIEAILELLKEGVTLKTDLVTEASRRSGISKPKITKVLKAHEGTDYAKGYRWTINKGEKNAKHYRITELWGHNVAARKYEVKSDGE